MKFYEVVNQVVALLQREGRVSYRALKREFDLDDDFLEDLKAELIETKELAVDKDGKMLVWVGGEAEGETAKRKTKVERLTPNVSRQRTNPQPLAPSPQQPSVANSR